MGNLHEGFGQTVKIRGNYEKQVKVRGHHHPLQITPDGRADRVATVFRISAMGSHGESV